MNIRKFYEQISKTGFIVSSHKEYVISLRKHRVRLINHGSNYNIEIKADEYEIICGHLFSLLNKRYDFEKDCYLPCDGEEEKIK